MRDGEVETRKGRALGPTPEDWIEVLTQPTTGPIVAGRFIGTGKNASYRACESGDLTAFRVGGKYRVPTEPLLQRVGLTTASAREAALRRAQKEIESRPGTRPECLEDIAA